MAFQRPRKNVLTCAEGRAFLKPGRDLSDETVPFKASRAQHLDEAGGDQEGAFCVVVILKLLCHAEKIAKMGASGNADRDVVYSSRGVAM